MEVSEKFQRAQNFVRKWEGGLTDDKYDAGGITKYGVSIVFLRDCWWTHERLKQCGVLDYPVTRETIKGLEYESAKKLFYLYFWQRGGFEDVPVPFDMFLYDFSVNCGIKTAIKKTQSCLGVSADGIIGPITIKKLEQCLTEPYVKLLCNARRNYYQAIVSRKR